MSTLKLKYNIENKVGWLIKKVENAFKNNISSDISGFEKKKFARPHAIRPHLYTSSERVLFIESLTLIPIFQLEVRKRGEKFLP